MVTIGVMLVVAPTRERTSVQHALRIIGLTSAGIVAIAIIADAVAAARGSTLLQGLLAKQAAIDPSSGRLGLWGEMLSQWWRNAPLVGFGAGEATRTAEALGFSSSHNAFVRVLVQRGIVGGLLVGMVVARASYNAYRVTRQGYMPALAVLTGLVAHSIFEDHLFSLGITIASVLFAQLVLLNSTRAMSQ
jgi:O-antigen ligase